jgi:hypothetical protein
LSSAIGDGGGLGPVVGAVGAGLVSAGPARAHLEVLRAAGGGTRAIAGAAGVARRSVSDVVSGRKARIRAETASRLLAVTVDDVNGQALVDAAPTVALLAHLVGDLGCSPAWIASQLGSRGRPRLQVGRRALVRARTARAVAELAKRIGGSMNIASEEESR